MKNETEQIILDVARKEFVQNGFTGTRMQAIADKAEINKAMLHYYFRSKEKLYQEIISDILNTMIPRFMEAMTKPGEFWVKVENLVKTHVSTLLEYPDIPFFIMFELSQKRESFIVEFKKRSGFSPVQNLIESMQKAMDDGTIRQVNPFHFMLSMIGMSIFPFMAKPIFCTIANLPEESFNELMKERTEFIMDFLKTALRPD